MILSLHKLQNTNRNEILEYFNTILGIKLDEFVQLLVKYLFYSLSNNLIEWNKGIITFYLIHLHNHSNKSLLPLRESKEADELSNPSHQLKINYLIWSFKLQLKQWMTSS